MIKINIDDYIAFTNKLIDANKLQRAFHIVEFVEGCCLAIDGDGDDVAIELQRDTRVLFWDKFGHAYRLSSERPAQIRPILNVDLLDNKSVGLSRSVDLIRVPIFDYPESDFQSDDEGDDALVNMRRAIEACKAWGRPIFGFMADNNDTNKLLSWCGGDRAFITKAFAKLMTESYDFSKIILQAAEMSSKIISAAERDTNAS
jgi:hypothetical protein